MRRKHMLSLFMLVAGVALLVAAMTVGAASSATHKATRQGARSRGGTLKVNAGNADFDFVDPQLAYRTDDWDMLFTTSMQLVSFPEKTGPAGSQLYPQAATAFPTVSKDGKTYTFHIRPGLKFSDGSPVTAAAFQRAWERILSPKMGSPLGVNLDLQDVVVGGDGLPRRQGAAHLRHHGQGAHAHVPPDEAERRRSCRSSACSGSRPSSRTCRTRATGLNTYPAAGPYYIASRDPGRSTVLKRNPYYKGDRPANPDQIVFTPNVERRPVAAAGEGRPVRHRPRRHPADRGAPTSAQQYGVNKGRFFVGPTSCVNYMGMNTARAPFNNVNLRKAVELRDRPPGPGPPARRVRRQAHRPDPRSGDPGLQAVQRVPAQGCRRREGQAGRRRGDRVGADAERRPHDRRPYSTNRAQVAEFNLKQVGFKINDVPTPATNYYQVIQTKGTSYNFVTNGGWCADYFDPFDYLNVLFDGRKIQAANNNDYTYFNNAELQQGPRRMRRRSPGQARANAYAKLDQELMTKYAPVVPYLVSTNRYFVSSRTKNWIYSTYFGAPYLNALSVG